MNNKTQTEELTPNHKGKIKAKNSPQHRRVSKLPDERRQEIIATAFTLFSEIGYKKTTMKDIADHMHVSQGLCYKYFPSKADLYAAASEYYANQFIEQLQMTELDQYSALEQLKIILNQIFTFATEHTQYEASFQERSAVGAIHIERVANQMIQIVLPIVEHGMKEGIFHCENAALSTRFLIYGLTQAFHYGMPEQGIDSYIEEFKLFIMKTTKQVLVIKENF